MRRPPLGLGAWKAADFQPGSGPFSHWTMPGASRLDRVSDPVRLWLSRIRPAVSFLASSPVPAETFPLSKLREASLTWGVQRPMMVAGVRKRLAPADRRQRLSLLRLLAGASLQPRHPARGSD